MTSNERFGLFRNWDGLNGNCLIGVFLTGVVGSSLGNAVNDSMIMSVCNQYLCVLMLSLVEGIMWCARSTSHMC